MDNQKLGMFTAQEKYLKPMQGELIEEPKEIKQEAPKRAEVESPIVRSVLDAYFRGAIEENGISAQYGYPTEDIVKILKDYQSGEYRIRRFSPILHDRIVEYLWSNPQMAKSEIEKRFFAKEGSVHGIYTGRKYLGLKYTKEYVKSRYYECSRRTGRKTKDIDPVYTKLQSMEIERDQLKQRVQELEELIWKQEGLIRCIREFAGMAPVSEVLEAE